MFRPIKFFSPFTLPIYFFAGVIGTGALLLRSPLSVTGQKVSWIDAFFTATSATCVTGLAVVDTGQVFSRFGQGVILALIQLGGLGVMTYSSLIFYLWRRRISLTDRVAVGQSLLHDPSFHLGRFLKHMVFLCLIVESFGTLALYLLDPVRFSPFSAAFHSISAFCNAGFSIFTDNLVGKRADLGVNVVIMLLIILGGLGFSVLIELISRCKQRLKRFNQRKPLPPLSWHARIVLGTSIFLILSGGAAIFLSEYLGRQSEMNGFEWVVASIFQSVSCRTAGFNTLDIGGMTSVSLMVMIFLMFIGGSPGSCSGGIKTTTFRAMLAFGKAQFQGDRQCVIGRFALDEGAMNRATALSIFAFLLVAGATLFLTISEGWGLPNTAARSQLLEILFEAVSAFGTVGLSMGLTPKLSVLGKLNIICLMFIGRLGPILFLLVLQNWRTKKHYEWPEETLLIG